MSKSRKRTPEEKRELALAEVKASMHLSAALHAAATEEGAISKTSLRTLCKAGLVHARDLRERGFPLLTPFGRELAEAMGWRRKVVAAAAEPEIVYRRARC